MTDKFIKSLEEKVLSGKEISYEEGMELVNVQGSLMFDLFVSANKIKERFVGKGVHLCSIINAKSGRCSEDCGFCAQSSFHKTNALVYDLVSSDEIVASAQKAQENLSTCFGIITSGKTIKTDKEFEAIHTAIRRIRAETDIMPSASLGMLSYERAVALQSAGLVTYHHNIETSRRFFPSVCTTHTYDENIQTIKNVKRAGLKVCSGVIFGLGEEKSDWVDMAFTLKELDIDSVPINFLNPIKNTRFENNEPTPPMELLKGISLFRFVLPNRKISICGGREKNLRDLQSYMFFAGASGTMVGNYLTTKGRDKEEDFTMVKDLGLEVE